MKNKIIQLPGLVDVHVHFRQPGATQKEDFSTGTKAAIAGGYTQVLDMPNNTPPTTTPNALKEKIKLAKGKIWCDLGFNFGATGTSTKYFKKVTNSVFGLKIYMSQTTGPLLIENEEERELIFKSWPGLLPIMVHAREETVEIAIKLSKKYKKRIHICHVTADQIAPIQKAKKEGLEITSEVCPHHLFLNQDDIKSLGAFGMMKPPLLIKSAQKKLWDNLDKIDMISTDHAPHTIEEKQDISSPKYGVPGLETTLPLMLEASANRLISIERFIEMASTNPRKIFNLPKQPDTYILVDISKKYELSSKKLFTKCNWTPFLNLKGRGEVIEVILKGTQVFKNGSFAGKPSGKIIQPEIKA